MNVDIVEAIFFWTTSYILIFKEIVIDGWTTFCHKKSIIWLMCSAVSQIYQQIPKVLTLAKILQLKTHVLLILL